MPRLAGQQPEYLVQAHQQIADTPEIVQPGRRFMPRTAAKVVIDDLEPRPKRRVAKPWNAQLMTLEMRRSPAPCGGTPGASSNRPHTSARCSVTTSLSRCRHFPQ